MNNDFKSLAIGILGGIICEILKIWFTKNFRHIEKSNNYNNQNYDTKILKKQFYITFPVGIICPFVSQFFDSSSFAFLGISITKYFMFTLSLFAFMCSIEKIEYLNHQLTQNNSKDKV